MRRSLVATMLLGATLVAAALVATGPGGARGVVASGQLSEPRVGQAIAFDETPPLRQLAPVRATAAEPSNIGEREGAPQVSAAAVPAEPDGALQTTKPANQMPGPLLTFEGPSNEDNFHAYGIRVNPPDPDGDVGRNHYVAMINLTFAVYSKQGQLLLGPAGIGTLWQGFAVDDCTDPSGDPIVLYDELANRWILTQFTTRGPEFFNCVAVSKTGDPTGAYFRYAFSTGPNFPDYPKYGVMPDSLYITTREFDPHVNESIGVYAINKAKLIAGDPSPEIVAFQLTGPPYLVGDGLLPADFDGKRLPPPHSPEVILGSMDDDAFDGAPFDGLNVFHFNVDWSNPAAATFALVKQLPIAEYDTNYPCAPGPRDCLPQPGIVNPEQFLDILSYRQRPIWRLQYRNFGTHESLVTNQSVEARPNQAGTRWWELRNPLDPVVYQEGTWAPDDGIHRWMGSVAMDKQGNLAVGYSVVDAVSVFPGIRYAGRVAGGPLGQITHDEAVLQNGSGVQTTTNSRWGDYTSMNVDPRDQCTFWYINEYYAKSGAPLPAPPGADTRPWQTRIGAFRFPDCH
jgi:hypothetical protein